MKVKTHGELFVVLDARHFGRVGREDDEGSPESVDELAVVVGMDPVSPGLEGRVDKVLKVGSWRNTAAFRFSF